MRWAFATFQGANWFPLTRLSWMLDAELFGVDAVAFHATSLLLHVLAATTLLLALYRVTGRLAPSAWVAASFALHPLHVESVAWAAARKDVLSGLCFALALLLHAGFGARPGSWRRAGTGSIAAYPVGSSARRPRTTAAFFDPKPIVLHITVSNSAGRPTFGTTSRSHSGSGSSWLIVGGTNRSRIANSEAATPAAPQAPCG